MSRQCRCLCGLPVPSPGETKSRCSLTAAVSAAWSGLVKNNDLGPTLITWLFFLLSWFVGESAKEDLQGKKSLSEKVSLYRGDITLLEVDAIVNAGRWLNVLCSCVLKILYSSVAQVWTLKSRLKLVHPVEIYRKYGFPPQFLHLASVHPVCIYCGRDYCETFIVWSPWKN